MSENVTDASMREKAKIGEAAFGALLARMSNLEHAVAAALDELADNQGQLAEAIEYLIGAVDKLAADTGVELPALPAVGGDDDADE